MPYDQLKLENQLCFPFYAASRLITREYQPYLDKLGITYPQYLVLLILWETDGVSVNDISGKLILNTNTVTPLLKRMEKQGLITRTRSGDDERKVIVHLTGSGKKMKRPAASIPEKLTAGIFSGEITDADLVRLKLQLNSIIGYLTRKERTIIV